MVLIIFALFFFGIGRFFTISSPYPPHYSIVEIDVYYTLYRITKAIDKNTVKFMYVGHFTARVFYDFVIVRL